MGQALYRKYRPKSVSDVVGQEHITDTLAHALKSGKLSHAYLFTGPRGTGKTSIARILAHEINDLPYTDDSMHMDIIEIDAASNRRIDEIRELRDKVNVAPTSAKYKVYIIDEVHMLTREAFNALLKTLEEPPAHVVFILATTESHKLPETIVSRTQRFMFKPVEQSKVVAHLRTIADGESIQINDEALELVAAYGEGSFRDSISLLDQARGHDGSIDGSYVRTLIGLPTDEAIETIYASLERHDTVQLSLTLTDLRDQGFAAPQVAKHLGQRLRRDILQGRVILNVFDLLQKLLNVPSAHEPETYLELVLLEYALAGRVTVATVVAPIPAVVPRLATSTLAPPTKKVAPEPIVPKIIKPTATKPTATAAKPLETPVAPTVATLKPKTMPPTTSTALEAANWPTVLDRLKKTHNTLYGIARMSRQEFYEDRLVLHFKFAFHQKRISEAKNRDVIIAAIRDVTGRTLAVKCLVEDKEDILHTSTSSAEVSNTKAPAATSDSLVAISNIFGNAEVLGS